jgi:tyrosyl-tRNA synthetase
MRLLKNPRNKQQLLKTVLQRGVAEVIEKAHLERKLKSGKRLRIKLGIDPTAPDLHLGHAVVLRKLKQFQDLGHKIVLIIGDFTGRIGDPAARLEARKTLTAQEVRRNMKTYLRQAGLIIDVKKAEIRYNSEWFLKEGVETIFSLARAGTIQQVLRRADFRQRLDAGRDITLLEVFYPLFQGYDSVKVKADVELGGTDQLFNLLMGRHIQRYFGLPEQDILTVPLLEGTDGVKKMSKSFNNYIALADPPKEMFGKVMSIKDSLIIKYFELCTDVPEEKIGEFRRLMKTKKLNPRDAKMALAYEIVSLYHGERQAKAAAEEFERVFRAGELPDEIPQIKVNKKAMPIIHLLVEVGFASSKSAALRLVEQGGVRANGVKITNPKEIIEIPKTGVIIRAGKRRFAEVRS